MSLQYLKKELSYEVDVLHADKHEGILQVYSITFDGFGKTCPQHPIKVVMSLWHPKKKFKTEVRDLTALAGSTTTLTTYYTSSVPTPITQEFYVIIT